MKKLIILLLALIPFISFAQNQEGQIIFKENIKIEIDLPPEAAHMKDMIPNSQSFDKVLRFTSSESIWENYDASAEQDATFEDTNADDSNVRINRQRNHGRTLRYGLHDATPSVSVQHAVAQACRHSLAGQMGPLSITAWRCVFLSYLPSPRRRSTS